MIIKNANNTINQRVKSKLVERDVEACLSYMVQELMGIEKFQVELEGVSVSYDYKEPVEEYINTLNLGELKDYLDYEGIPYQDSATPEDLVGLVLGDLEDSDSWEYYADENGIDPEIHESLEYWAVSEWLARKLEEKGEPVLYDFLGFNIWGRSCSGQAIQLDGVMSEIAHNMNILEGQENHSMWAAHRWA